MFIKMVDILNVNGRMEKQLEKESYTAMIEIF